MQEFTGKILESTIAMQTLCEHLGVSQEPFYAKFAADQGRDADFVRAPEVEIHLDISDKSHFV